jgi:hypothetical protein
MPSMKSMFMSAGRYGPNAAFGDSAGRAMTESFAPFAFQNYENERAKMHDAATMAPGLAMEDYKDIGMIDAVGQQRQLLGEQELQDAVRRWQYYQDLPYLKLDQYGKSIAGAYGGTTTSAEPYYQPSVWSQLAGLGIGAAGALSGLGWAPLAAASDIRVKTDVTKIGELPEGTNVYSFKYVGSPTTEIGVVAQEIEDRYPEAVSEFSGVKIVDYGKLAESISKELN